MKRKPPLDGIVILSFEHAIAAPLCTRQLAELGAELSKLSAAKPATSLEVMTPEQKGNRHILFGQIVLRRV